MFSTLNTENRMACESHEKYLIMKKHKHEIQNEIKKISQTPSFVPNNYGDRFIPRRYSNIGRKTALLPTSQHDIFDLINVDGYWRQHEIKKILNSNFQISSKEKLLNFHDYLTKQFRKQSLGQRSLVSRFLENFANVDRFDWPCVPRKKAAAIIESTYDIGDYSRFSDRSIMTWSSKGNFATSFEKHLIIWMPSEEPMWFEIQGITSLVYNSNGQFLAIGIKRRHIPPEIQIWNVSSNSVAVLETNFKYDDSCDEVFCLEWDPKNKYVVSGMLHGNINIHKVKKTLKRITKLKLSKDVKCITNLKFSNNGTYLASADNSGYVSVWTFGSFNVNLNWQNDRKALIAWHPWNEPYLIISSTFPASICLVDVSTKEIIAYYYRSDSACEIEGITFNPLSAELVVCVVVKDDDDQRAYEIVVLASLDRLVDLLTAHESSVKLLIWSSDGTMLATLGEDNKLNLWKFFGYAENKSIDKVDEKKNNSTSKITLGNPSLLR